MPFDEEDNDKISERSKKVGLKNVSSQKSIFDTMAKKPTQNDLDNKVKKMNSQSTKYKMRASELTIQFNKVMADKTLAQNKNIFQQDLEKDLLLQMIQLAIDINNDDAESEGMGSVSWIVLLFKTCFAQRDRVNNLEYSISKLESKISPAILNDFISKEIAKALDSLKKSE